MVIVKGLGVNSEVALGKVIIKETNKIEISHKLISKDEVENELIKFKQSIVNSTEDIDFMIKNYTYSKDDRDILTTHKYILKDPEFIKSIEYLISNELMSLENAIDNHFTNSIKLLKTMGDDFFVHRAVDYEDVQQRLLNVVMGRKLEFEADINENNILVMTDIAPSIVPMIYKKNISGLCLEEGSLTAHSSIIARSLNLPTIVGAKNIFQNVKNEDLVILDCKNDSILINPDDETIEKYKVIIKKQKEEKSNLLKLKDIESTTKDNQKITLMNNIEFLDEIDTFLKFNAEGIGLFRTEFLFLGRKEIPSEEEQFDVYKSVVSKLDNKLCMIRTVDIGGDKLSNKFNIAKEKNPNLGLRGVRLTLRHPEMLKSQIRALLRASVYGKIKIMFPMISGVQELEAAMQIVRICMNELKLEGVKFDENIEFGTMIEVPSAVLSIDRLAVKTDFFSIGTNDLIQYTLAVDRNSDNVAEYYNPYHPAIIKALKIISDSNIPVSICGELASDSNFLPVFIGLGIKNLSVSPNHTLKIKNCILNLSEKLCRELVDELLFLDTSDEIKEKIKKWRKKNGIKI